MAHVIYLAGPETRSVHSKWLRKLIRKLKRWHRRRTLLSYATNTTEWDYPSHIVPNNETKTYLTKDSGFLRKLEGLMKDTSSRKPPAVVSSELKLS